MAADTRESAAELEKFRRQWQEEVSARKKTGTAASSSRSAAKSHQSARSARTAQDLPEVQKAIADKKEAVEGEVRTYHDLADKDEARKLGETGSRRRPSTQSEPSSALEHYEKAVERENEGSLGDSLNLYRKAYRLDAAVDRAYKNKHFPTSSTSTQASLLQVTNPSNALPTAAPSTTQASSTGAALTISELIASFASLSIPPMPPPTEGSPAPPCPIAVLPQELLTQILLHIAELNPSMFTRLSLVCKRFAYLVSAEDAIWRNVCHDRRHGFPAMHYSWACNLSGTQLASSIEDFDHHPTAVEPETIRAPVLPLIPPYPSYRIMYHSRPRIRFSGCYISTVNYIRPGAATATQVTWNSPVLIVTYYRYLRFFRDGSCISLLTTAEPVDVVHYLTKENMQSKAHPSGLPTAVMNHALRGRWRLSGDAFEEKAKKRRSRQQQGVNVAKKDTEDKGESMKVQAGLDMDTAKLRIHDRPEEKDDDDGEDEENEAEGIVHIETEGADAHAANPKYLYKMILRLQNAGGGGGAFGAGGTKSGIGTGGGGGGKTRNNKLAWMGYWNYNRLTDDWAEFGLRNDRAFFWSRVKSYGDGE